MTIRQASLHDIDQLSRLFDNYRVWYNSVSDIKKAKSYLTDRINNNESTIYVADKNGELLGFTQLYPLFSSIRMNNIWLLNDLFVAKEARGLGLGVKLIEKAQDLARDTNSAGLMLETDKSNDVGNQLYPKMGFVLQDYSNFYNWSNKIQ